MAGQNSQAPEPAPAGWIGLYGLFASELAFFSASRILLQSALASTEELAWAIWLNGPTNFFHSQSSLRTSREILSRIFDPSTNGQFQRER